MAKTKKKITSAKKKIKRWPSERNVMFRPERLKYIKGQRTKSTTASDCVFCESLKQGTSLETLVLAKTTKAMVVLNKYPYNPGHLMVLPRRHEGDILKIESEEYMEVMELVRVTISSLKALYDSKDFNVGINLGRGAGAGIPEHMHVHVVPRWPGDLNFFPLIADTKVIPADMKSIYEDLQKILISKIEAHPLFAKASSHV